MTSPTGGAAPREAPAVSADSDVALPPGTRFVADAKTGKYYPAGCQAVARIAPADRLYYTTEKSTQADGYRRDDVC